MKTEDTYTTAEVEAAQEFATEREELGKRLLDRIWEGLDRDGEGTWSQDVIRESRARLRDLENELLKPAGLDLSDAARLREQGIIQYTTGICRVQAYRRG